MLTTLIYSLLALDQTIAQFAAQHGAWLYGLLFAVIFAETGLVVMPFLPGDSLLFVAGTVVAAAGLDVHVLAIVLVVAAVFGDSVNYAVGRYIGPKIFAQPSSGWFRQDHLRRTQEFYGRYGGAAIIIGRFVPIVRTFVPFVAGVAAMRYRHFLTCNITGAIAWIASLVYAGFLFGNFLWVKQNLAWIILAIVAASLLPALITYAKERRSRRQSGRAG